MNPGPPAVDRVERAHAALALVPRTILLPPPSSHPLTSLSAHRPFWVARDDGLTPGGTKVRKLATLLASPPWRDADRWAGIGATGSGQLEALAAAADAHGRALDVYCVPSAEPQPARWMAVQDVADRVFRAPNRVALALRYPGVFTAERRRGAVIVPPGATHPVATLGVVDAALRLADDVASGAVPVPERVYVAAGSGGTAAGLAIGFGLAGLPTTVHAVRVVEAPLLTTGRQRHIVTETLRTLAALGIRDVPMTRWVLRRGQAGRYGVSTSASQAAATSLAGAAIPADGVYVGKAAACAFADAAASPGESPWLLWISGSAAPTRAA